MKRFCHAIVVTGLVAAPAFPAYAASHSMDAIMMTCVDFTAMDVEDQMKSMEAMHKALDEMSLDEMSSEELVSDETASDERASDETASDEMMAIASACEGNPDMMVLDAMTSN